MKIDYQALDKLWDAMKERKFHKQFRVVASVLAYKGGKLDELRKFIVDNDITDEETINDWLDENIDYDEITDNDDEEVK